MICSHCGHRMENEDANYCGRCGGLLRASGVSVEDMDEERDYRGVEADRVERLRDPWRDVALYQGKALGQRADDRPAIPATPPPDHRDSGSLDTTRVLGLRDQEGLLHRPTIVPPGELPESSGASREIGIPGTSEEGVPALDNSAATSNSSAVPADAASSGADSAPAEAGTDPVTGAAETAPTIDAPPLFARPTDGAGVEPALAESDDGVEYGGRPASEAAGTGAASPKPDSLPVEEVPLPAGPPARGGATASVSRAAAMVPLSPGGSGCLRIAGCTISIHAGPVPLVEVSLNEGAVLSSAAGGLLWASERLQIDLLPAAFLSGEGSATSPLHLQARGPGALALTPGTACTVVPVELAPGASLEVAAGVLLAWSRGIRAARTGAPDIFPAGRLTADRTSLALLRCPGGVHCLELPPGGRLTAAPRALLATMGAVGCATLRRHGAAETAVLVEYRLSGPGRVLLGGSPLGVVRR